MFSLVIMTEPYASHDASAIEHSVQVFDVQTFNNSKHAGITDALHTAF